jgi:hypothetical protein
MAVPACFSAPEKLSGNSRQTFPVRKNLPGIPGGFFSTGKTCREIPETFSVREKHAGKSPRTFPARKKPPGIPADFFPSGKTCRDVPPSFSRAEKHGWTRKSRPRAVRNETVHAPGIELSAQKEHDGSALNNPPENQSDIMLSGQWDLIINHWAEPAAW